MFNYDLRPRLQLLTLTVNNNAEYWEEKLEFIGTEEKWLEVEELAEKLSN